MIRKVGVVVPAANEQATIGACLDSVADAVAHLRGSSRHAVEVRTVVVLDRCVDRSEAIARSRGVRVLKCDRGSAGAARRVGAESVLRDFAAPRTDVWLANTDADSTVPGNWLVRQVEEAADGAHVVLGTVLPQPGLAARVEQAWFDKHRLRDGHPHVHGANLGIRADVYAALGGWPDLATGEDIVLARRAASAGHLRICRTAGIPVLTSVRLAARAPDGFARFLTELAPGDTGELAG